MFNILLMVKLVGDKTAITAKKESIIDDEIKNKYSVYKSIR